MSTEEKQDFEEHLQVIHAEGAHERVLILALERYGGQLAGFQLKMLNRNATLAEESWSMFLEDVWKGLPKFQWRSRLKTWLFTIARNAVCRLKRQPRFRVHEVTYSPSIARAAAVPFTTAIGLNTAADHFNDYFVKLSEEDQWICAMRAGCRLSWKQAAHVLNDWGDDPIDEPTLKTECNRLRNRYNRLQRKMREWAQEDGLRLKD